MLENKYLMPRFFTQIAITMTCNCSRMNHQDQPFPLFGGRFSFFIKYKRIAHTPFCTWFNKLIKVYGAKKVDKSFSSRCSSKPLNAHLIFARRLSNAFNLKELFTRRGLMIISTTSRYRNNFRSYKYKYFTPKDIYIYSFYDITHKEILQAFLL